MKNSLQNKPNKEQKDKKHKNLKNIYAHHVKIVFKRQKHEN